MAATETGGPLLDALAQALLKHRASKVKWEDAGEDLRQHLRGDVLPVLRALGEVVGDDAREIVEKIRLRHVGRQGRVLFSLSDEEAAALVVAMAVRKVP